MGSAKILRKKTTWLTKWTQVNEKTIVFAGQENEATYHSLSQYDYVTILAVTPSMKIPIVRQFRFGIEDYTLELPAGIIEDNESAESACIRELKEETGLVTKKVTFLGKKYADAGRLENSNFMFYVETGEQIEQFQEEPGVEVKFLSLAEVQLLILNGKFSQQPHVGLFYEAQIRGCRLD